MAPRLVPVRNVPPAIASRTPRMVAPVEPSASATAASRPWPARPPWLRPSVSSNPRTATARPSRNGRMSTSSLRVTINAPSGTSTSGARYAATPTPAFTTCATGPPLKPNQRTAARKTPRPASASPTSSGCSCARFLSRRAPRRFLTRLGVFGDVLRGRFLRAMPGTSPRCPSLLPRERRRQHPEVRGRLVRDELRVVARAGERAVEHQHLPEAVGQRGLRVLGVPRGELAQRVSAHDVLDLLVVGTRVLAE